MMKRRMVFLATMAAALLMAFGGVAAQAAGSIPSAHAQQQVNQEPGLVIVSVDPSGPAAAAGVKRGDILLEVDGQKTDRNGGDKFCDTFMKPFAGILRSEICSGQKLDVVMGGNTAVDDSDIAVPGVKRGQYGFFH